MSSIVSAIGLFFNWELLNQQAMHNLFTKFSSFTVRETSEWVNSKLQHSVRIGRGSTPLNQSGLYCFSIYFQLTCSAGESRVMTISMFCYSFNVLLQAEGRCFTFLSFKKWRLLALASKTVHVYFFNCVFSCLHGYQLKKWWWHSTNNRIWQTFYI